MKCSVFIATSVDGYIAREDGDIEWLNQANEISLKVREGSSAIGGAVALGDAGYSAFFETIDVMVMGRKSFEKILSFGAWPYGEMPVIVLSRNSIEIPKELSAFVSWSADSPKELTDRLAGMGINRIYVDGGNTIQRFMAAKLIDDICITTIPVLLGAGIPLFGQIENDISLAVTNTRVFENGFVQVFYNVIY
jgi:dihydrofolate reductase